MMKKVRDHREEFVQNLSFNRDSIEFMRKRWTDELQGRTKDSESYLSHMAELLDAPPASGNMVLYATIQQILSHTDGREEVKDFLRTLMAYYEAREDVKELEAKVAAIDTLLDPDGPLSLAKVSFDDIPIFEGQSHEPTGGP